MTNLFLVLTFLALAAMVAGLPGAGAALDPDKSGQRRWYRLPESIAVPMTVVGFFASLIFYFLSTVANAF